MEVSTIAAIATPSGLGGIGIIRISGPEALKILSLLFRPRRSRLRSGEGGVGSWESHRLVYGEITDPRDGATIDEALVAFMKAPKSYTSEDIVEIQVHGGPVGLRTILDLVLRSGARLAEPGEFTRRAFLNGRIDLSQAEAVIDLIQSRTTAGLKMATAQLGGEMRRCIEGLRKALREVLVEIEAGIDFPEEVHSEHLEIDLSNRLRDQVRIPLSEMVERFEHGRILREGFRLGVIGRPNVGKSSLMNRLLDEERVIVTEIPGTTRDAVEEQMDLYGIPVIITDTAGLQNSFDPVEKIGMQKTREVIARADGILFVVDGSQPPTESDWVIFEQIPPEKTLLVVNKIDKRTGRDPWQIPDSLKGVPVVEISALYNRQLDTLKRTIAGMAAAMPADEIEHGLIPNLRHQAAMKNAIDATTRSEDDLRQGQPMELVAIGIEAALSSLGKILGIEIREDLLEDIFNRFCIGK
ncbi:MAG: tRNA uridine-5-carboxymethylaminomethyl(34) synthesis GTPase MnmE [Desulfobacterales bacterium]|nr:tRNA uridine-5-carboxymethylaminomethyl(34) synthesis GTPase MnmE [Desulfobacterales bacterium]